MKANIFNSIFISIIAFILFMLQTSNLNPLPIINIPINYLVVLAISIACYSNTYQRIFVSLLCGILIDLWFSSCSFYILSLLIVNNIISIFSSQTKVGRFFILVAVFVGTILVELINASFLGFCLYTTPFNPFIIYKQYIIKLSIGNVSFSMIIYNLLNYFFNIKNKKIIFDDKYEIDI
jgi:hypothetical protein